MNLNRPFLLLGLLLAAGLAVFGAEIRRALLEGREYNRYLSVRGLSEREVKATLAIWPIQFSALADDLGGLKSAMGRERTVVATFLHENGIEASETTMGLPQVRDRVDERTPDNKPLTRYLGVTTLVVRSPHVDVVKKAIQGADVLLDRGVTLLANEGAERPQFVYDEVNDVKPDMIREATANARAAAEKFAVDSKSRVGRIRRASQGALEIDDRDPASPERKLLRVVTTVDFFLE